MQCRPVRGPPWPGCWWLSRESRYWRPARGRLEWRCEGNITVRYQPHLALSSRPQPRLQRAPGPWPDTRSVSRPGPQHPVLRKCKVTKPRTTNTANQHFHKITLETKSCWKSKWVHFNFINFLRNSAQSLLVLPSLSRNEIHFILTLCHPVN